MKQDQKLKHKHWQQKGKKENAKSNLKRYTLFYAFCSSYHHALFLLKDISLFLLCFSLKWRLTFFSAIFVFKMLIYYIVFFYSHILIIIFIVILFFWKKQIGIISQSFSCNPAFYESDTAKSTHNRIIGLYSKYLVNDGFTF